MLLLLLLPVICIAAEELVVIDIEGMTCDLWPIAIKKSLVGIEGVTAVKISYEEKTGWVTVDEAISNERLLEAIKKAGPYTGKIKERMKQQGSKKE